MNVSILIEIDYYNLEEDGQWYPKTYYLANGAETKEHVYYPYLYSIPTLGIGGEGFSKVSTGQISIVNIDEDDEYHPFASDRFYRLIEQAQEIPFRMYYQNELAPIFVGNLALSNVTEEELQFLIVEEKFEKALTYPVLERGENSTEIPKFYLYKPFTLSDGTVNDGSVVEVEYRVLCSSFRFEEKDLTEIIFERTYQHREQASTFDPFKALDYERSRDNRYLVAPETAGLNRFMMVDPEDQDDHVTLEDLWNEDAYEKQIDTLLTDAGIDPTTLSNSEKLLTLMGFDPTSMTPLNASYSYSHTGTLGNAQWTYRELIGLQTDAQGYDATTADKYAQRHGEIYEVPNTPEHDYYVGVPVINPFSFGSVRMKSPVRVFGARKVKRNYENFDASQSFVIKPSNPIAQVTTAANFKIFDEVVGRAGQSYRAPRYRTDKLIEISQGVRVSGGLNAFSDVSIIDSDTGQVYPSNSHPGGPIPFKKIRVKLSGDTRDFVYGNMETYAYGYNSFDGVNKTTYSQRPSYKDQFWTIKISGQSGSELDEYAYAVPASKAWTPLDYSQTDPNTNVTTKENYIIWRSNGTQDSMGNDLGDYSLVLDGVETPTSDPDTPTGSLGWSNRKEITLRSEIASFPADTTVEPRYRIILKDFLAYDTPTEKHFYIEKLVDIPSTWTGASAGSSLEDLFNQNGAKITKLTNFELEIEVSATSPRLFDGSSSFSITFCYWVTRQVQVLVDAGQQLIEKIEAVPAYYFEDARKQVYQKRGKWGASDPAYGVDWAEKISFNKEDSGYYVSQIYIENDIIYESPLKTKVAYTTNSSLRKSGNRSLPQMITFTSISNNVNLPNPSEYYRLYRTDDTLPNQPLILLRIKDGKLPTFVNASSSRSQLSSGHYRDIVEVSNLQLQYDGKDDCAYLDLECYVGTQITEILFLDSAGSTIDSLMNITGSFRKTLSKYQIPTNTQSIKIYAENDDTKVDDYSKYVIGFDAFIYQRIFPVMNSSLISNPTYVVIGCINWLKNGLAGKTSNVLISHYTDFHATGSESAEGYEAFDSEKTVYSIHNPNLMVKDNHGYKIQVFDDGVPLGESQIYYEMSDDDFINLSVDPYGEIAVTGYSRIGNTLEEFYRHVVNELEVEDDIYASLPGEIDGNLDLSMAPYSSFMSVPVYQDSDMTVIEMAEKIAKSTNHQFYFRYVADVDGRIRRELVLIDLNYVLSAAMPFYRDIPYIEIISISLSFPYPIKAYESTFTRNVAYSADINQNIGETVMKSLSSTYRLPGAGVGNVETYDIMAESLDEGRYWLSRIKETSKLPSVNLEYNGIDRQVKIGSKISFTDEFRKISGYLIVQELNYNFENDSTEVSGVSMLKEIVHEE